MSYCTTDDIIAEFKSLTISGANTIITTAKLTEFITQTSSIIDSRLASKFVVPVTAGSGALEVLKNICVWIVAERVNKILDNKIAIPGQNLTIMKIGIGTAKDAQKMLDDIMANNMQLIGATLLNASGGIKSNNVSHNQKHTFHRNREQW